MNEKDLMRAGEALLRHAKRYGATDAIVSLSDVERKSVNVRYGNIDDVALSGGTSFSITAIVGERRGYVDGSSFAENDLESSAKNAVALAKQVAKNPHLRLATPDEWPCSIEELPKHLAKLDRVDPRPPPTLRELEESARILDTYANAYRRIARSEGSGYGYARGTSLRIISNGWVSASTYTRYSKETSLIAEQNGAMNSAADWHSAFHYNDLRSDEECARRAGEYVMAHLGARRIPTGVMPVLFDKRVSPRLLRALIAAIDGTRVYNKATFLLDHLGRQIFPSDVTILESPHVPRSIDSCIYDDECVKKSPWRLVDRGCLTTWVTTLESASKLGMKSSTGHAGGTSNLTLLPTTRKRADIIRNMKRGLIVTELGNGVNLATGAYSTGAAGLLVENGEIVCPVNKITIAGNLLAMWKNMQVADDLSDNPGMNAPSCFVDEMMVGGE